MKEEPCVELALSGVAAAEDDERRTPGWILLGELSCAMLIAAHCLAGVRGVLIDSCIFTGAALLIYALGRYLPAPPEKRPAGRELFLLVAFSVFGAGATVAFGAAHGATPPAALIARSLGVYAGWAFLQQFLTQRYLVLRLRHWLGWRSPLKVAGLVALLFALFHLPYPALILPTAVAGFVWTAYYLTSGRLLPVVLSHALLGSCFILWVLDRDPFASLFALLLS